MNIFINQRLLEKQKKIQTQKNKIAYEYAKKIIDERNYVFLQNMVKKMEDNAYELYLKCKENSENYIFIFWSGNNPITLNRLKSIKALLEISEAHVIYVTVNNLNKFILEEQPFHKAYNFLSVIHKSDYLRCYFMNFYGGGYSDIKKPSGSWKKSFEDLKNSDKWINGYKWEEEDKSLYNWIGNGAYIAKSNTPLTNEWYSEILKYLDHNLDIIKTYPATHYRDSLETSNNKYPVKWATMGIILNKLTDKYNDKLIRTLPICICSDYL
jgi:hypothetical protein